MEKKQNKVMMVEIPNCSWKPSTRKPKANLQKIAYLWLLFPCSFCTFGKKLFFFPSIFLLACGTESTTRKSLTTRNRSCKPGFMNSFKGMSYKGYFVLLSNMLSFQRPFSALQTLMNGTSPKQRTSGLEILSLCFWKRPLFWLSPFLDNQPEL